MPVWKLMGISKECMNSEHIETKTKWTTFRRRHFEMYFFFLNENAWILIKMLLKFAPKGPTNKIPA